MIGRLSQWSGCSESCGDSPILMFQGNSCKALEEVVEIAHDTARLEHAVAVAALVAG